MLWPASEEFAALCRTQLELIVNSLGASSLAVYLSETLNDSPSWFPVAVYPEAAPPLSLPMSSTLSLLTAAPEIPLTYHPQQVVSSLTNHLILP